MRRLQFASGPIPPGPYAMNPSEVTAGIVVGFDPSMRPLERRHAVPVDLVQSLEAAILPALLRPPCLVSFSGGRDSSALLAIAAHAARRHGLPEPIPATNRFPGSAAVDETDWQELVVGHLKLKEWVRVEVTDELDLLGPLAEPYLRRFGVLWPFNFHFLSTVGPQVAGGTLLTGMGGDEIFLPSVPIGVRVLAGERRPHRGDIRRIAAAVSPSFVRARREARRGERLPWLRTQASSDRGRALARQTQTPGLWWGSDILNYYWRSRHRRAAVQSIASATRGDPLIIHPFMDPEFLRAATATAWRTGFPSRDVAMEHLVGSLLPAAVIHRRDKVAFFQPLVNHFSRRFIASWDGSGVDPELVDIDALRRTWNQENVDARSYCLLQGAWLAQNPPG